MRVIQKGLSEMYTRIVYCVAAFLWFQVCSGTLSAQNVEHTDTLIVYLSCDGPPMVAELHGNFFKVAPTGTHDFKKIKLSRTICYQTWDGGGKWTASLRNRVFLHAPNGDWKHAHSERFIRYKTSDGDEWTTYVVNRTTFRHIPKVPQTKAGPQEADAIKKHVEFALNDSGTPQEDCVHGHLQCCSALFPPEPRSWIARQAVIAAKKGNDDSAVHLIAMTQCHNTDVARFLESHRDDTVAELKKH